MKRYLWGCALLMMLLVYPGRVRAQEAMQEAIDQVLGTLELEALTQALEGTDALEDGDIRALLSELASGKKTVPFEEVIRALAGRIGRSFASMQAVVLQIAIPALMYVLITQLSQALAREEIAGAVRYVCLLLLLIPLCAVLVRQAQQVSTTVQDISRRMQLLFPMLLTLLSAVGGSASSAFLQPAILSASAAMTQIVTSVTLRLSLCAGAVTAVNHLSGRMHLTRLADLLKRAAGWTLGICFTLFIGVMTIQGFGAAVTDGISLRMAKYAIDNFVPVVGGMFSDTVDMLVGCSLLVKNALGIVAMLVLLAVIFAPVLQLGMLLFAMRFCTAMLEPVAEQPVIACMDDFVGILSLLFITLLCVGAMFFLLLAQLLLVGNLTVMMR